MHVSRVGMFLLLALASSVASAFAQTPLRVGVANVPSTHINVLGAAFVHGDAGDYACVAYVNNAQTALSMARFKLFVMSPESKDLGVQIIEVSSPVAPGARMTVPRSDEAPDPSMMPNCKLLPFAKEKIGMVMMLPDRFEFADGTSWMLPSHSPSPAPTGTPSLLPT